MRRQVLLVVALVALAGAGAGGAAVAEGGAAVAEGGAAVAEGGAASAVGAVGASRLPGHAAGAAVAGGAAGEARAAAAPTIRQLVVFRDGSATQRAVSTRATRVRVADRRCTTGNGTALSALVRSRPGRLRLRDFGSCSRRTEDGGGLFVTGIRGDVNRGQNGWVYKVGRRAATAGAADPGGPFGRGRLRAGQRVTWFYCRLRGGGCQRTLELKLRSEPGVLMASVRAYDDEGRGAPVEGAAIRAGASASARSDASGAARLALVPGRYRVRAEKNGTVRSFAARVEVP